MNRHHMGRHSAQAVTIRQQSGMALIMVLLFLILIMIAGAIAVRQGIVDLNVATSDQTGTLMLNSSDSVLAHIEQAAGNAEATGYKMIMSQTNGVLGYFMLNGQDKINHQVLFCYQPDNANIFDRATAARYLPGVSALQNAGGAGAICNPATASHYNSSRATTMTQVAVRGIENALSDNFQSREVGTSADVLSQEYMPQVAIYSTAVMPAMSSVSNDVITGCLSKPVGDVTTYGLPATSPDMSTCLKDNGVPANALVEEGAIRNKQSGGYDATTGSVTSAL